MLVRYRWAVEKRADEANSPNGDSQELTRRLIDQSRRLVRASAGQVPTPIEGPAESITYVEGAGTEEQLFPLTEVSIPPSDGESDNEENSTWASGPRSGRRSLPEGSMAPIATERYQDRGTLGSGGMGVVRRVQDRLLNRCLAMKILHTRLLDNEHSVQRFVQEAQVGGQLQHPNILPVYDLGVLPDGHIYFTMAEIVGASLTDRIREVHDAIDQGRWMDAGNGWNLHRLIGVFYDVCKAVSYAHEHGVAHRDLKPDNVMIGPFGEVLVVDWGLAKVVGSSNETKSVVTMRSEGMAHQTMEGTVTGTPAYMAPEQASGRLQSVDLRSDIYGLGVILYEILAGRAAFPGFDTYEVLGRVIRGDYRSLRGGPASESPLATGSADSGVNDNNATEAWRPASGAPIPEALIDACERAMAHAFENRYPNVGGFADVIGAWLDGSERRTAAVELVVEAEELEDDVERALTEARTLNEHAADVSATIEPWRSEDDKLKHWQLEDRAKRLEMQAVILRTEQLQLLRASLAHKDDLFEAHAALTKLWRDRHQEAEARGDEIGAEQASVMLREHLRALPVSSRLRSDTLRYVSGDGTLSLDTVPSRVRGSLVQYGLKGRRLVPVAESDLGMTPVRDMTLKMGTYCIRLRRPGYHEAMVPVHNRRLACITSEDPDGNPVPIRLLQEGTLAEDDCYVPAGWTELGGDSGTPNSLPRQRVWIDGFVIKKFSVTHQEYLFYLNDLLTSDRVDEAQRNVPREQSSGDGKGGVVVYQEHERGGRLVRYELPDDPQRLIAWPDHPVTMISWQSARDYAAWYADQTAKPWRLPMEFEWEKSARGVDARHYPWGDSFDPSWACMKDSHRDQVRIQSVDSFPVDESVYGVRGTAGNTRDWCLDKFREDGPPLERGRLLMPTEEELADQGFKSTRGGSYGNSASRSRSADRDWWFPQRSYVGRGFRLVWGLRDWEETP